MDPGDYSSASTRLCPALFRGLWIQTVSKSQGPWTHRTWQEYIYYLASVSDKDRKTQDGHVEGWSSQKRKSKLSGDVKKFQRNFICFCPGAGLGLGLLCDPGCFNPTGVCMKFRGAQPEENTDTLSLLCTIQLACPLKQVSQAPFGERHSSFQTSDKWCHLPSIDNWLWPWITHWPLVGHSVPSSLKCGWAVMTEEQLPLWSPF